MFLEYWMIGILMVIWTMGMIHMQKVGFERGWRFGTREGSLITYQALARHGILTEKVFEEFKRNLGQEK